jgi:hypothetical protein
MTVRLLDFDAFGGDPIGSDPPLHPELQAWRERTGRADRIGDGEVSQACLKAYRETFPDRPGDRVFNPAAGTMPIPVGRYGDSGRWDALGYFVPNKVT